MNNIRKIIADKIAKLKDKRVNDYADGFNDGLFEAFKVFLEVTDELVNKETPMKPIDKYTEKVRDYLNEDSFVYVNFETGYCPNCNEEVNEYYIYCNNCGQRLDWGNYE